MDNFGLISIIMAAYNAENTIEMAIDSVISQTYKNWELIVVNDCSKDNTLNIIENYALKDPRIKVLTNEKNNGVSITRLNALKASKGEWIAILDSDDVWTLTKLEKQIELYKSTSAKIIYTGVSYMNADSTPIDWVLHVPLEVNFRKLLKQNVIANSSALVKKELFEKYYVIGDDIHEDFALWLNILKTGIKAAGIDEPLVIYRVSSDSKSGNKIKSAIMNWKTYRYIGLNMFSSAYYMVWYTIKGILKYKNIK